MSQFANLTAQCKSASDGTVAGCLSRTSPMGIYNFLDQAIELSQNPAACGGDKDATLQWQRIVSEDFINCCGANKLEYRFFEEIFSSAPKFIDTTQYHQRYRGNENENVISGSNLLDAAGVSNRFKLHGSSHNSNGKASSLSEGMNLYNYRTSQMLQITAINKAADFSHILSVRSTNNATVNVTSGDKFIRVPGVLIGGVSCPIGDTTMNNNFTTKRLNKLRLRTKWCMDKEVDKPYDDHMMFAQWIDKDGNASERAMPIMKMRAMQEITQAANLWMFLGNTITNPAIQVDGFTGGEGFFEAIKGAGNVHDYDASLGFSVIDDFENIILSEDAMKRTTEWMLSGSLKFRMAMNKRFRKDTNNEIVSLDFGSITRYGPGKKKLEKYDIEEYSFSGRKVMFNEWGWLSTENGLGNGKFPETGFMLAMNGLYNSKNEEVPPIQYFRSQSSFGKWEDLLENDRDKWLIDGCEKWEGDLIKSCFWMVHCPNRHYLLNPKYC